MSTEEMAWQAGESAASVLGLEAGLFASADAAGLGASTLAVLRRAARRPGATGAAALRYWTSKHKGSWWEDWTAWSDARAGAHVKPPPLGSKRHPALGDAPGDYVRG
jgi:hypothetical protein